ncbi:EthD family reductase [Roseivirga sp.]|uniref:EthD family reductase n=1 Tax=Roseivirga sp. TaxID=1964215 RepID=UPI003B8BF6A5
MVKLVVVYGHPEDPAAFEKYYAETHLPIAGQIKGVSKVELTKFIGTPDGQKASNYRMAEVYFPTLDELQKQMGSAEGQAAVNDLANFATGGADASVAEVG